VLLSMAAMVTAFLMTTDNVQADEIDDIYYYCIDAYPGQMFAQQDCIDREIDALEAREYGSGSGSYSGSSPFSDGSSYGGSYQQYDDDYSSPTCPGVTYNKSCVCDRCPSEFDYGTNYYRIYEACSQYFDDRAPNGISPCASQ